MSTSTLLRQNKTGATYIDTDRGSNRSAKLMPALFTPTIHRSVLCAFLSLMLKLYSILVFLLRDMHGLF